MATPKKAAAKSAVNKKASGTAKKASQPAAKKGTSKSIPAKKVAAPKKAASKPAPKSPAKKAVVTKQVAAVKKAAPAKKAASAPSKNNNNVNKKASNTVVKQAASSKAVATKKSAAPAAPASKKAAAVAPKAAPAAKKAAPALAKKAAPAPAKATATKPAAPAKKSVAPAAPKPAAKAAAPDVTKKPAPAAKQPVAQSQAEPVKTAAIAAEPVVKKPKKVKEPVRKVIVMPPTSNAPAPAPRPVFNRPAVKEEKKPGIIVAQRRVESKDSKVDTSKTMINYQPEYTRSILDTNPEPTGPVYRYSDEELNEFREIVQSRLESSRKDLTYLQGLLTRKDEAGTEDSDNRYMNMEDGSGAMEREQMAQLASRQIQLINNLEKAMMRIENKTYGICRVTGKLIDKARLRAVPHATLSIEAKNTMSKK